MYFTLRMAQFPKGAIQGIQKELNPSPISHRHFPQTPRRQQLNLGTNLVGNQLSISHIPRADELSPQG